MSEEPRRKWDRWPAEFRQTGFRTDEGLLEREGLAKELGVARQLLYVWKLEAEGQRKPSQAVASEDSPLRSGR